MRLAFLAILGVTMLSCGGITAAPVDGGGGADAAGSVGKEDGGNEPIGKDAAAIPVPPFDAGVIDSDGGLSPIATTMVAGAGIASDGTYVYWLLPGTAGGAIERCAISGCNDAPTEVASNLTIFSTTFPTTNLSTTNLLANGGGFLYWTESAGVADFPLPSTSTPPITVFSAATWPVQVTTDATRAYWTTARGTTIRSCPLGASCATPTTVLTAPTGTSPTLVAVDDSNIYWSDGVDTYGNVYSRPIAGGTAVTMATGVYVSAMVAFGGRLYWTANDGCGDFLGIYTCLANAPCTPTVYTPDIWAAGVVIDPTSATLYWTSLWTSTAAGSVHKCALGATCASPITIAQNINTPTVITVDATNVYFLSGNGFPTSGSPNGYVYAVGK